MSQASEARTDALDRVLDQLGLGDDGAEQLWAVVDVVDRSPSLRRNLSDPGSEPQARRGLTQQVFGGRVADPVVELVAEGTALRWSSGADLVAALERQAVRAELKRADGAGGLDAVEDELFRFARLVEANPEVRNSLAEKAVPLANRQQLVVDLLQDRVSDSTIRLARRAVNARERTFGRTIDGYVNLAATQRQRTLATVRVAHQLDADQLSRLAAALTRQAGRPIAVQVVIDPTVVGGARVELGDQVIEGTVAGRLDGARRSLTD